MNITLTDHQTLQIFCQLPEDIQALLKMYPRQLVLAGGYLRDMECRQQLHARDIDLFLRGGLNPDHVMQDIPHDSEYRSSHALTLGRKRNPDIQLVHRYNTEHPMLIENLLERFDFACCRSALWHDGVKPVCMRDSEFADDCRNRVLTYRGGDNPGNSLRRVIKLAGRGWHIPHEDLAKVVGHLFRDTDFMDAERCYSAGTIDDTITRLITPENY